MPGRLESQYEGYRVSNRGTGIFESTTASCFVCTKKSLHTFIFLSLLSYWLKNPLGRVYEPVGGCSWIMCTPIFPDLCLPFCFFGKAHIKFLFSSCTEFTSCLSEVHCYDGFHIPWCLLKFSLFHLYLSIFSERFQLTHNSIPSFRQIWKILFL